MDSRFSGCFGVAEDPHPSPLPEGEGIGWRERWNPIFSHWFESAELVESRACRKVDGVKETFTPSTGSKIKERSFSFPSLICPLSLWERARACPGLDPGVRVLPQHRTSQESSNGTPLFAQKFPDLAVSLHHSRRPVLTTHVTPSS